MGTTVAFVPVEEYLSTSYPDGDREYVDGEIVERNMGETQHGRIQGLIFFYFCLHYKQFWCGVEIRTKLAPRRYRIPDVCLVTDRRPPEGPLTTPPFLAVEVLSPDDRAGDLEEKISDYLSYGVKYVWVINPRTKRAYIHSAAGIQEAKDGILRTENPAIEMPLTAVFEN